MSRMFWDIVGILRSIKNNDGEWCTVIAWILYTIRRLGVH